MKFHVDTRPKLLLIASSRWGFSVLSSCDSLFKIPDTAPIGLFDSVLAFRALEMIF